jgi:hypothetical protein
MKAKRKRRLFLLFYAVIGLIGAGMLSAGTILFQMSGGIGATVSIWITIAIGFVGDLAIYYVLFRERGKTRKHWRGR